MTPILSEKIQVGDIIMPPEREMTLWMRRHIMERNLSEAALHLTVTQIREGTPDKRGRWLIIKSDQSKEWNNAGNYEGTLPFTFKVRPTTLWPLVSR